MHPVHAVWGVDRRHIARMGGETAYPMRMNLAMLGVPSAVMAKSK